MKPSHKKTNYNTRSAFQKALVDLRWGAPAYGEAMHRRWNAFIAGKIRGKRDAKIEPLQARPQSYGCFELHEDPDFLETGRRRLFRLSDRADGRRP